MRPSPGKTKTETKEKLIKLNRLYLLNSRICQAIIKATGERELFEEACRIAAEPANFRAASVALQHNDKLVPFLHAGENIHDPGPAPIALPITCSGNLAAVFSLYPQKDDSFDADDVLLLSQLSADLSFAMDQFARERHRRKTEQELLKSKLSYQTLTEISPVGVFHTDASGTTTYVNRRWCEISGMSPEQALGDGWLDAVHPDDREALSKGWRQATSNRATSVSEYRFIRPDGAIAWILGQAVPEIDADNDIVGYVGTATDISDLKQAQSQLVSERNLSDSIINSLPGIFYLFNREGHHLRWNQNFEKVTSYTSEEFKDLRPQDFFDQPDKELIREKIENVFRVGEDTVQANLVTKAGKKIPYYLTGKFIRYAGQDCLVGVGIDFSDKVRAQEKIRQTAARLRELATHLQNIREEERIDIARDIHDDLGQQLTAVRIALFRIAKMAAGNPPLEQKIGSAIDMTGNVIDSIRRIALQLRPAVLDDLGLVEAMKWQIEEFEKRFSVPVAANFSAIPDDLAPEMSINLFRIFQETLTNIARHAGATYVEIDFKKEGPRLRLTVKDNGRGLNPEDMNAKRTLGLLGMKERAYSIGGQFETAGRPGQGTTIDIVIPLDK